MWLTEGEKNQVCKYAVELEPDMTEKDVMAYLAVLKQYCAAESTNQIFEILKKDEVVDFCYRTEYPDHYNLLDNQHKQAVRRCVIAVISGIGANA